MVSVLVYRSGADSTNRNSCVVQLNSAVCAVAVVS